MCARSSATNGCEGLRIETRLNGEVVQHASTSDMNVDVETRVALLSEVMTHRVGDPAAIVGLDPRDACSTGRLHF
ncbi:fumarylacetoacetate hydrolase family protein [Burkholderia ubonensis]|uniref:fumarylacetoacetate hydrolase family protein n=1 Tax=Burkholderia ubonensis TaxID=101571 RepID=UPI001160203D|nr:fumarylacetoacetate hydrolase family protein [Burkholderia ubonensis]